jgi:hypothetical protein
MQKIFKKLSSTVFSIVPNGKILLILLSKINGEKKERNSQGTMAIAT